MNAKIPTSIPSLKGQLLAWASQFEVFVLLDSNELRNASIQTALCDYEMVLAADVAHEMGTATSSFKELNAFTKGRYAFGHLSYDLKNELENLSSKNFDGVSFPEAYFFEPKHIVGITGSGEICILKSEQPAECIRQQILAASYQVVESKAKTIRHRVSKQEYIEAVKGIKQHIMRGDIYEMNYCQEFYVEDAHIDPISTYLTLTQLSPTPFACFYRLHDRYLISASPERFMLKKGPKVISQPIKGTIRRGENAQEDEMLKAELRNNLKEQSENVMIVDLVRNDLSKTAKDGSVVVSELFGIYPFRQVFQMISTVESEISDSATPVDVIREAFPMGSMTGAPKVRAMQLIEEYEATKRGLYSGAVGYFTPDGDFDFNVIIRSILYNQANRYLSFSVGSAITFGSSPEMEYAECEVKAKAIVEVLTKKGSF